MSTSVEQFVPIKIVGWDENKVKKQPGDKECYAIPFSLSAKPPKPWAETLEKSWRGLRKAAGAPKADMYLKKGDLVVESPLGEIAQHFQILKAAVDEANNKYGELVAEKTEKDGKRKQKSHEKREAELTAVREALAGLDFS
jgi:hypothetical protein